MFCDCGVPLGCVFCLLSCNRNIGNDNDNNDNGNHLCGNDLRVLDKFACNIIGVFACNIICVFACFFISVFACFFFSVFAPSTLLLLSTLLSFAMDNADNDDSSLSI
jgi:hypothetical protein